MQLTPELLRAALTLGSDPLPHGPIDTTAARPAAVAVPIAFTPEPRVLLVLRGAHLTDHAGEVGFPGGKPEPGDADLHATAAREMREEVAIDTSDIEWLGALHPCPVITGRYMIHPFVAHVRASARPHVASSEIARIIELPILPLVMGEAPVYATEGEWMGAVWRTPHIHLDGCTLYGASAFILYELLAKIAAQLGRELPPLQIVDTPPWGDRYAHL